MTDHGELGFVADPFLHSVGDELHLFFEVFSPLRDPTAAIGHAVSENPGQEWTYTGLALSIDRHLSFPYVFAADGEIYMVPDIANSGKYRAPARLYWASEFPHEWEPIADIITGPDKYQDTVVFQKGSRWWAIAGTGANDEISVYYSEDLTKPNWTPHPDNPVVADRPTAGRPAGRPIVTDDAIIAFFQDSTGEYGSGLRAYEITTLDTSTYEERPLFEEPVLVGTGGVGWNSGRMHHLDLRMIDGELYCAYDGDVGFGRNRVSGSMWAIGFGLPAESVPSD
ncbi:glucosamine inositolphosphorylceramide transferase family protein [Halorientalis salina]|uniref:glucosamine inositolphosphorylceramide transferase family protein n=1 Tax=Halorientalis salina TaxID=2932266 RepID=UPI0010ACC46D|nr:hypothetical protein [Halorientalis salina]